MGKIVFILGAGASMDCGAPLMRDFLDTASRLMSVDDVGEKRDHFERVFKAISALQAVHSKSQLDLNNIESIFTALEIAKILGKLPGFEPNEIPLVIASLKEVIVTTLENTIEFPVSRSQIQPTPTYNYFSETINYLKNEAHPSMSSSVITFNYDVALDVAMHRHGQGPIYGFGPDISSRVKTHLLKLHGSLNWAVRSDTREVIPLNLQTYFEKYVINMTQESGVIRMKIGTQIQEYYSKFTDIKVEQEPLIVPPTWNKADYHNSLSKIWALAAKELEDADYIFIMGYSLPETDAFFRLLYGLGSVGKTLLKKLAVFNPDQTGGVEGRFRAMLGLGALARFEYHATTFNSGVSRVKAMFPSKGM